MKNKIKNEKGITLIALVVTIIVLIILAGVSVNLLIGDNGIIKRAQEAGEVYNLATVKEKLQLEVLAMKIENVNMTSSEIIDKLKEANIINNNLEFVGNTEYSVSYNGNIMDSSGKIVDTFDIQGDNVITELEVPVAKNAGRMNSGATCTVRCVSGTVVMDPNDDDGTIICILM